ncbi:hypothetical protein JCM15415_16780 [Methanobacterium movens]
MKSNNAFLKFAPSILKIYNQDKDTFWKAVMAPYLSDSNILTMLRYRKIGKELMVAFKGLDENVKLELIDFSAPLGFDINNWNSLSVKSEYFKDAYPIFAFLVIWMEEEKLKDLIENFDDILKAAVFGIAGYGILDVNVDGEDSSPVEILTAQALISEYENLLLNVFGVSEVNLDILHRIRSLFLKAEIKEKSVRGKKSPYTLEKPIECGFKAAHLLTPFMLSLDRLDKSDLIEDYFKVFSLFGAVIQIMDDWKDLEEDLEVGHYSYVTLGFEEPLHSKKPSQMAKILKKDKIHIRKNYETCKDMLDQSISILKDINDPYLTRIVNVTELRLDSFFHKDLKMP